MRDWFPSALSSLGGRLLELMEPSRPLGSIFYNNHSENEIVSPILVNAKTAEWRPLGSFFDVFGFMNDVAAIGDRFRSKPVMKVQLAIAAAKHFNSALAPEGFGLNELLQVLEGVIHRAGPAAADSSRESSYEPTWNLLTVVGMWFVDSYNYDVRKIQNSSTPVGTQEGEIDFSTYNSAGWRQIVEYLHTTASLSEWNKTQGRHNIYSTRTARPDCRP